MSMGGELPDPCGFPVAGPARVPYQGGARLATGGREGKVEYPPIDMALRDDNLRADGKNAKVPKTTSRGFATLATSCLMVIFQQ